MADTRKRNKTKTVSKQSTSEAAATKIEVRALSLTKYLADVKRGAAAAVAQGSPVGACLVTNPHTGQRVCVETDKATCTGMKGRFIGGPCGL